MPETLAPIGILGGTFDPIHHGHLRLAEEAAELCGLSRVLLIPAALPNLRVAPRTLAHHRLAMARLAAGENPKLAVDGRELDRVGMSYTVDTLEELRKELGPAPSLCLILGADAFSRLPAWHRWQRLFELAHIVVAARPGYDVQSAALASSELASQWGPRLANEMSELAATPCGSIAAIRIPLLEISATDIRSRIARGASARYLAPQEVLDYIAAHRLYTGCNERVG